MGGFLASDTATESDPDGGARKPLPWSRFSYTTRLTVSFAAIAAMTALVAIGVLSFVWEQHFQSYTRANLEDTADAIAGNIAERYAETGAFDLYVLSPAIETYELSNGLGIPVTDADGTTLWDSSIPLRESEEEESTEDGLFSSEAVVGDIGAASDGNAGSTGGDVTADSGTSASGSSATTSASSSASSTDGEGEDPSSSESSEGGGDASTDAGTGDGTENAFSEAEESSEKSESSVPSEAERISSSIVVDSEVVGRVSVWVYGANTLLTQEDLEFRNKSYQAMVLAAAFAIVLALCIGFLFARNLVRPINRMTSTAASIKEGNMSARTGLHGDDEISRLGETFDAMAESVEKDRELERRLTTDVAHELRTPLMAIQSTVEAMVDGVFDIDTDRLEVVNSEVQRLSRLVDALLRLSKLENRSTPMKEELVDVGSLVESIISTHEAFVIDSGLTLEHHLETNVYVYGDADMIRQATANLISNAVRYTPEGGNITVTVKKGDLMASIAVKDTGIGLSEEEARMVFSRFWRADAGRNRATGGLGIGLTVVKEIVDRHGGWVQVEGKPDRGATFTIYIPLYDETRIRSMKAKEKAKGKTK